MSASAASQLSFDLPPSQLDPGSAPRSEGMSRIARPEQEDNAPASIRQPSLKDYVSVVAARRAGRINAAGISPEKHQALLGERAALLEKKYSDGLGNGLEKSDRTRLTYVEWQLDRIEDAKSGEQLDLLEDAAARYEYFLREIRSLKDQIREAGGTF